MAQEANLMATPCPAVPQALLDWMEDAFPGKLPVTLIPADEIARLVGQQDVIRKLRVEHSRQQNNLLKS